MSENGERTAEEREAARLERERRRAGRAEAAGVPEQAAGAFGADEQTGAFEAHDHRGAFEADEHPDAFDTDEHTDTFDTDEHTGEFETGDFETGEFDTDEHSGEYATGEFDTGEHPHEAPAGTRRISALHRKPPARQPIRRKQGRHLGRPHSWRGRIGGLIAIVVAVGLIWFLVQLFQPFHGSGHGSVTVTIPPHASADQIATLLEHDGVISSSFFFNIRATLAGDRSDLHSGTYHLKLDMPYSDVLTALTTTPPAAKVTNLTLIEGRSRREIDGLLRHQGVRGSYLAQTRRSRLLDPTRYGASRSTPSLEGFLFPSTYQLREPVSIGALVADQLKTFKQEFAHVNMSWARRHHLTPYQVLIVASMVEGEAQNEADRRNVASVVYNRLRDGMPLQIDATSCYVQIHLPCRLSNAALNSPSPYNTRIHKGLPPTPIDNPGLASIQAAANPPRTNYLYFVVKPCGNGKMIFTGDYQQFLRDAAQYQQARAKRGNRSPAKC
jgi:UPF0755 protein